METFAIRNLSFSYPGQAKKAIDGFTLSIAQGEFLVLCGPSGCGKSTLLRCLKPAIAPHGQKSGEILFEGVPPEALDLRTQSQKIGFVQQSPDNQLVTDKVWHELAFGLESLGFDTPAIRRRVAEMASFFGIESWFYKNVTELSGGQKQLLNLASVMAVSPSVLILDEPTAQLDPIAAADLLAALGRINRELGTTVILSEHRLEDALPFASTLAVMDGGRLLCAGAPKEVGAALRERGHAAFRAMPTAMRVWAAADTASACPLTVREGRVWLTDFAARRGLQPLPAEAPHRCGEEAAIEAEELWFRYEKDAPDVVRGLSLSLKKGEFLALLGGNGTGKSTTLKLLAGLLKPYRGQVRSVGRTGLLVQDAQALFVKKTVREDLAELLQGRALSRDEQARRLDEAVRLCRLQALLERHPYDLSGGEQQRAALAKVLLTEPDILLLDEPTKGLDAAFKESFAEILQSLLRRGVSILMVSHDVEFCARYAHRCALFFDGGIVTQGPPRTFFSGNSFYTTAANRMARALVPEAITSENLIAVCGGEPPREEVAPHEAPAPPQSAESAPERPPFPAWRKFLASASGALSLFLLVQTVRVTDLSALIGAEGLTPLADGQLKLYALMIFAMLVFAFSSSRRTARPMRAPRKRRGFDRCSAAAAATVLLLVPLTLYVGEAFWSGRKYYFIALLILLECTLPFFALFERRKPQAREVVVIAVLCAIGVAGRAAFFMLPEFKPVWAVAVLAGAAFGAETGFLVGVMTMLASNVLFSQGPWTPWQMFAMGAVGFLAGLLFGRGLLRRSRLSLCAFGAVCCIVVYGGIMNGAAALMWAGTLNKSILLTYYVSGFPVDCIHAAATWLFLWFAAEPTLEKLERIKLKYGLNE